MFKTIRRSNYDISIVINISCIIIIIIIIIIISSSSTTKQANETNNNTTSAGQKFGLSWLWIGIAQPRSTRAAGEPDQKTRKVG